jgi:hypothetical protein
LNLILWDWEKGKILGKQSVALRGLTSLDSPIPFQLSFNPINPIDLNCSKVLVTGPSTFVYLKMMRNEDGDFDFSVVHSQINNLDSGRNLSDQYTCHAWAGADLIVCTDQGEVLICGNDGEHK